MLSVGPRPGISKGWLASMSVKPTPSETRYVQSGDILVAYQVFGDGPRDLVIVPGFVSHIEQAWEDPSYAPFLKQLSSFSRVIFFDKRGTGMSERAVSSAWTMSALSWTRPVRNGRPCLASLKALR